MAGSKKLKKRQTAKLVADIAVQDICKECGSEIRAGSVFCYNCGAAVNAGVGTTDAISEIAQSLPQDTSQEETVATDARNAEFFGSLEPDIAVKDNGTATSTKMQTAANLRKKKKAFNRRTVEIEWGDRTDNSLGFIIGASVLILITCVLLFLAYSLR